MVSQTSESVQGFSDAGLRWGCPRVAAPASEKRQGTKSRDGCGVASAGSMGNWRQPSRLDDAGSGVLRLRAMTGGSRFISIVDVCCDRRLPRPCIQRHYRCDGPSCIIAAQFVAPIQVDTAVLDLHEPLHELSIPSGVAMCRGSQPGAKTSMIIMRPPQLGHG